MAKAHKVLMLSSWYPTRINPTLGNFNEKFAEAAALYNEVTVIHVTADNSINKAFEIITDKIRDVNTHIVYFRKERKENILDKMLKAYRFLKYYFKAYKLYKKENGTPDILHLNILYPVGIIALLFKKIYGIPYVISENWTGYLPAKRVKQNFWASFISRIVAKNAAALLPVSQDLKNAMLSLGFKAPYHIVHNVTDIQHFNLPDSQRVEEKIIILHVSSLLDEHKNITGILNVAKRMYTKNLNFELHIVGDGDALPHIDYAKKLELPDTMIRFFGTMSPEEIAEKMKSSDFFVLFSNYENLPCVIVEAMAAGLPVVSSTAGGVPEHLTTDKGILVEPKDEKALYEACLHMISHCRSYDKKMLHDYAVNNFSYQSIGQQLTDIYKKFNKNIS